MAIGEAEEFRANMIWTGNNPSTSVVATSSLTQNVVTENILQTISSAAILGGSIEYTAMWYPLTKDSNLVTV